MSATADVTRLAAYRMRLFAAIGRALAIDGYCKSVEGRVSVHMPDYFAERDGRAQWAIEVYVYVLGPTRSYMFTGRDLNECLDKAYAALIDWERELDDEDDA